MCAALVDRPAPSAGSRANRLTSTTPVRLLNARLTDLAERYALFNDRSPTNHVVKPFATNLPFSNLIKYVC